MRQDNVIHVTMATMAQTVSLNAHLSAMIHNVAKSLGSVEDACLEAMVISVKRFVRLPALNKSVIGKQEGVAKVASMDCGEKHVE